MFVLSHFYTIAVSQNLFFFFAGIAYLAAGDYLELKPSHGDSEIKLSEDVTYFGAVQVSHLPNLVMGV